MRKKLLKQVDLFGSPISLNYNGQDQFRTNFGGVMSIILTIFLTVLLISKVSSFWYRETIQVTEITEIDPEPDLLVLNQKNFMFAVSIEQHDTAYNQNPYFQIEIAQRSYQKHNNGLKQKSSIFLHLEPCTIAHWLNLKSEHGKNREEYWQNQFDSNNLQNWLCPTMDYELRMAGVFHSQLFEFIKIEIVDCKENNENFPKWNNYQCAKQEQLDRHLENNGNFRFQLYSSNYQINAQSNKEFDIPYLQSDLHFSFSPVKKYQMVDIFMENVGIETNENVYYQDDTQYITKQTYPIISLNQVRAESDSNVDKKFGLSSIYLRKSQLNTHIQREFQHFNDLVSYIGGYTQFFILLFGCIVGHINYLQQLVSFINNLYVIKNEEFKPKKQFEGKEQHINKEEYLQKEFKQMMSNIIKFKINFKYLLYKFFKHKAYNNPDNQFIDRGIELAQKQTDIMQIIGKLHEFDKLKSLLLSKDQLYLFNCTPKAILEKNSNINILKQKNNSNNNNKLQNQKMQKKVTPFRQLKSFLKQDKQYDLVKQQEFTNLDVQNNMYQVHKFGEDQEYTQEQVARKSIKFQKSLDLSYNKYLLVLKAKNKFLSLISEKRVYHHDSYRQFKKNMVILGKIQDTQKDDKYQKYINNGLYQQMGIQIKNAYRMYKSIVPSFTPTNCKTVEKSIIDENRGFLNLSNNTINNTKTEQNQTKIFNLSQSEQNQNQSQKISIKIKDLSDIQTTNAQEPV